MDADNLIGAGLIVIGGILTGMYALPMKYARHWNYENIWLIFAIVGLVVVPWLVTYWTVPDLLQVYADTDARSLWAIVLFGAGWGVGCTLSGLGLFMVGISLGYSVLLGVTAVMGSLIPLLVQTPGKLFTIQGVWYVAGTALMLLGISLGTIAGVRRERNTNAMGVRKGSLGAGLAVCIAAGAFSSALNYSFAFGGHATEAARALGVSPKWATNVIWAPAVSGGFLANLVYCSHLLRKNGSTSNFRLAGTGVYWLYGILMGILWFSGLSVYGVGAYRMGSLGAVIGWPLFMGMIIVTSNVVGLMTHEWRGTGRLAKAYLISGTTVIVVAVIILSLASQVRV